MQIDVEERSGSRPPTDSALPFQLTLSHPTPPAKLIVSGSVCETLAAAQVRSVIFPILNQTGVSRQHGQRAPYAGNQTIETVPAHPCCQKAG